MKWLTGKRILIFIITAVILFLLAGVSKPNGAEQAGVLSNIVNIPLAPFQKLFSSIENGIKQRFTYMEDISRLQQENEDLRSKVDEYSKYAEENISLLEQVGQLREALNLKDRYREMVLEGSNIISWNSGNWYDLFTVDKGTADGIKSGKDSFYSNYSAVVTGAGLVGRVVEYNTLTSKVMSIISQDSVVSGMLTKSRQYVDVLGSVYYQQDGLCIIDDIGDEIVIEEGDSVETSGVGGNYPKGILIGTVIKIVRDETNLKRYAVLKPAVDFKKLETVYILVKRDG